MLKVESVINDLKENDFFIFDDENIIEDLQNSNMQVWTDNGRVVVLKEYRTETSFLNWLKMDQPIIGELYNHLVSKHKKNLYFFIILNFRIENEEVQLEINKAEKNNYVCKKCVFSNENDFEKIPFLNRTLNVESNFNYDEKFKKTITDPSIIEKVRSNTGDCIEDDFYENANKLLEFYFNKYFEEDNNFEKNIKDILKMGDYNVYK